MSTLPQIKHPDPPQHDHPQLSLVEREPIESPDGADSIFSESSILLVMLLSFASFGAAFVAWLLIPSFRAWLLL